MGSKVDPDGMVGGALRAAKAREILEEKDPGRPIQDPWTHRGLEWLAALEVAESFGPVPLRRLGDMHKEALRERLLAVRRAAKRLTGAIRRRRALTRMGRALAAACGIKAGPARIEVARGVDGEDLVPKMRSAIRAAAAAVAPQCPEYALYLRTETRLVSVKLATVADRRITIRKWARQANLHDIASLDPAWCEHYRKGDDVICHPQNWRVPAHVSAERRRKDAAGQVDKWQKHVGATSQTAEQLKELLPIGKEDWGSGTLREYRKTLLTPPGLLVTPRDGDRSRVMARHPAGAPLEVATGICHREGRFKIREDLTRASVAKGMETLAEKFLPRRSRPKILPKWDPNQLPYMYGFPKASCYEQGWLNEQNGGSAPSGWYPAPPKCSKPHLHTREVCAKNIAPAWIVRWIKRAAKGMSVVLRSFEGRTFRLWRQADLRAELQARILRARGTLAPQCHCWNCRKPKPVIDFAELDANSFFPSCYPSTILAAVLGILALVIEERKTETVTVDARRRHHGFVGGCAWDKRRGRVPTGMIELLQAVAYELLCNFALFGDHVLQMMFAAQGSSFSEVLCDVVLSWMELNLNAKWEELVRDGIAPEGTTKWEDVLWALRHVDDVLVGSEVLCRECMIAIMAHAIPPEIGWGLKGAGPSLVFLHAVVHHAEGRDISLLPHLPNADFAVGATPIQTRAVVPPGSWNVQQLRMYLQGRFATHHQLRLDAMFALAAGALVCQEVVRVGYTPRQVEMAIGGIPKGRTTPSWAFLLKAFRMVRKAVETTEPGGERGGQ